MALSKKQKILLPFIILVLIYIGWQIYNLIFGSKNVIQSKHSLVKIHPTRESIRLNSHSSITTEQSEYLKMINHYNLLKLKHLLLEEEAAITAAKQRIIKSRSEISNMTRNMESEVDFELDGILASAVYELVYLDYQKGHWNALLNQGGRFFEVQDGTKVANGDRVLRIDKDGVVINHKGQILQITFDGLNVLSKNYEKLDLPVPIFFSTKQEIAKRKKGKKIIDTYEK